MWTGHLDDPTLCWHHNKKINDKQFPGTADTGSFKQNKCNQNELPPNEKI